MQGEQGESGSQETGDNSDGHRDPDEGKILGLVFYKADGKGNRPNTRGNQKVSQLLL
jgi:hypothetical protein